jgi:hypothetical protein
MTAKANIDFRDFMGASPFEETPINEGTGEFTAHAFILDRNNS